MYGHDISRQALFLLSLWLHVYAIQAQDCSGVPAQCSCHNFTDVVVNCTFRGLQNLPETFPDDVTHIYLEGNHIIVIESSFHKYTNLKYLDLSNNKLSYISHDTFYGLYNLQELYLNSNYLNMTYMDEIRPFRNLTSLSTLDISDNQVLQAYPTKLFDELQSLEILKINSIPFGNVSLDCDVLVNLKKIYLYAFIQHVQNTTFEALRTCPITFLAIWSGWLETLESYSFAHFPHLETLDLSYNPRLGFVNASMAWPGLKHTNISTLILKRASPFETSIVTVEKSFFHGLNETKIKKLILDENNIVTIYAGFSQCLPLLKYLSFAWNRLTQVWPLMLDVGKLTHLKYLDASRQSKRMYASEHEMLVRRSSNTHLGGIANTLFAQPYSFNIQPNRSIDPKKPAPLPNGIPWLLILPRTLEYFNVSQTLTLEVEASPTITILNAINLKVLDYSGNGFRIFNGSLIVAGKSRNGLSLDLSDNGCYSVSPFFLSNPTAEKVETLLLGNNELNNFLQSEYTSLFAPLDNLKHLDLSSNVLKQLPDDVFTSLLSLQHLDLHQNALREFHVNLVTLEQLQSLDLSDNLLSRIDMSTQNQLHLISRKQQDRIPFLFTLNLARNPLVCSCDNSDMLHWIQEERRQLYIDFVQFDEYYCHYHGGYKEWGNGGLDTLIRDMYWECNRRLIIVLSTVLPLVLALIISLSICANRHRWDIRFWLINMVIKRREKHQRWTELTDCSFKYDVFVAHHEHDMPWVKKQMIPNLEASPHDFSLCIQDRDFELGHVIEEHIVKSIKESSKTILVISKYFLKSNWCYFEMQMARAESFEIGRSIIIPILLEPISHTTEGISPTLLNILKNRTYIMWPEDPGQHDEFWSRIRQAIQSRHETPNRCECGRALFRDGRMYLPDGGNVPLPVAETFESH